MHTDPLRASERDAPTAFCGLRSRAFAPCEVFVPALSPRVLSLTAAMLLANAPAVAQQPQPTALETIVITSVGLPEPKDATKLLPVYPGGQIAVGARAGFLGNRDYSDLPFSAVGYTAEMAEEKQARTVSDVVVADPSVTITFPRASYRDVMRIRGFDFFTYNMTFNGLPGILPKQRVLPQNAERIEVLKGPDTFLNGVPTGATVGGSINVVPKRALEDPITDVTLTYESNANFGTHLDYGRRSGEGGAWGLRTNISVSGGDLTIDDQSETLGAAIVALDYRGERFRLNFDSGWQKQRIDAPEWVFRLARGATVPSAPDASSSMSQPWAWFETEDKFALLGAELDISDNWTAFARAGISTTETNNLFAAPINLQSNGDFTVSGRTFPASGTHKVAETGLRGNVHTGPIRHDLALAALVWDQDAKVGFNVLPGRTPSSIYDPVVVPEPDTSGVVPLDDLHQTSDNRFSSLALTDTISIWDERFQLMAGGRFQRINTKNYFGTTGSLRSSYDKSAFTPAVGLVVKPWDGLSFYGNYMEGLERGDTAPAGTANAGEVFAPAVSRQIEAGTRYDFGNWMVSLAAFQITRPNGITDVNTNVFSVDGEQRNRGLELNVAGEPLDGLRILGGVAFIDAVMTKTEGGTLDGKKAIGVPDYRISLGAQIDIPRVPGLMASGRIIHTASQYANAANTQELPGWTRLDLGLAYSFERPQGDPVVVRLGVENVLDTDYWASASDGQVTGISRGAPRTFLLSTKFSF